MNFEKALEAMKQRKKVFRTCWGCNPICYLSIQNLFGEEHIVICIGNKQRNFNRIDDYYQIPFDDWEIYEEPHEEPETAAEKAKSILRAVRAEAICRGMVFEDCSLEEFVAAIDFALEILKKQAEKEKKVSQLDENAQKKQEAANKCGFNCKIQPAKFFPDDIPTLAFDMFTAGLKLGLEIAKDSQKRESENE